MQLRRAAFSRVLALVVTIPPSAAGADELGDARDHYQKGSRAFDLGRYDDAVREFAAAYELRPDPVLLYNLAQAQRLAGRPLEAMRLYQRFLALAPDSDRRGEVEAKIKSPNPTAPGTVAFTLPKEMRPTHQWLLPSVVFEVGGDGSVSPARVDVGTSGDVTINVYSKEALYWITLDGLSFTLN